MYRHHSDDSTAEHSPTVLLSSTDSELLCCRHRERGREGGRESRALSSSTGTQPTDTVSLGGWADGRSRSVLTRARQRSITGVDQYAPRGMHAPWESRDAATDNNRNTMKSGLALITSQTDRREYTGYSCRQTARDALRYITSFLAKGKLEEHSSDRILR